MRSVYYNRGDEILTVIVSDQTGRKIETRRCNLSDGKEGGKIMRWLKEKWNFTPLIDKDFLSLDNEFFKY